MKKISIKFGIIIFILFQVIALVSCGGGGSSNNSPAGTSGPNNNPIANAPTVTMSNPINGSNNVPVDTDIELSFSRAVKNVSNTTILIHSNSESNLIIESITPESNNVYKVTMAKNLANSTKYTVDVTSGIQAVDDNESLEPAQFNFTTSAQIVAATVQIISPQNNSITESTSPEITVKFSDSVVGVNSSTFKLFKSGQKNGQIIPQEIVSESNNVYKFVLSSPLNGNTSYIVAITDGITTASNNLPVKPANFRFLVSTPIFAYVTYSDGVDLCTVDKKTGDFSDCALIFSTPTGAYSVTIDPSYNYAYIAHRYSSGDITSCKIDKSTGYFYSCADTGSVFATPTSLAFTSNESSMYIANGLTSVSRCPISGPGELPAYALCHATGKNYTNPTSIVVGPTDSYSYIVNETSQNITICSIDPASGGLTLCSTGATGFTSPQGATFSTNGKYLYVTNKTSVRSCMVSEIDGSLSSCSNSGNISSQLSAIAVSKGYSYLTDTNAGTVFFCKDGESTGTISSCNSVKYAFTNPTGIAILDK